jgi:RNA polymerase sporulation-specific sigma factor
MIKQLLAFIRKIYYGIGRIYYLGSTDKLPEPLTREKEIKYLKLAKKGDLKSRDILIEHNLRLVVFLSKKYENTGFDLEDLVSIGTIGLIKGINTFDLNKNIKLATYASRCIDNEILMFLRKNKKIKTEISFEDSLTYDNDGNELHLEDVLGTDKDIVTKELETKMEKNILLSEINKLHHRDREIMMLRYGLNNQEEMTQKDVANKLGISQSYISRIEKKIIRRLKALVGL